VRTVAAAALAVALIAGCGDKAPADEPGDVADRFVDLYFVEIDQQRLLPITSGVARQRIEDELREVAAVRATGYTAGAAKPRVFYERTMLQTDDTAGRARAVYDIRIKHGDDETRRHALISLSNRDGKNWTVASFAVQDGPAARR
jgi:hypothetical protein